MTLRVRYRGTYNITTIKEGKGYLNRFFNNRLFYTDGIKIFT